MTIQRDEFEAWYKEYKADIEYAVPDPQDNMVVKEFMRGAYLRGINKGLEMATRIVNAKE